MEGICTYFFSFLYLRIHRSFLKCEREKSFSKPALCHLCLFFFLAKRFSKMLFLKMKSMSLTTCLFCVSFFHNVGNLSKQKLIKEVQGIRVVPCVTPVFAIRADSLYCFRQFASSAFHGIQELETQTVMTEKIFSALKLNETLWSILSDNFEKPSTLWLNSQWLQGSTHTLFPFLITCKNHGTCKMRPFHKEPDWRGQSDYSGAQQPGRKHSWVYTLFPFWITYKNHGTCKMRPFHKEPDWRGQSDYSGAQQPGRKHSWVYTNSGRHKWVRRCILYAGDNFGNLVTGAYSFVFFCSFINY